MNRSNALASTPASTLSLGQRGVVIWTLALLPLAGLLISLGVWWRGPSLDPSVAPQAFIDAALLPGASVGWLAILVGMIFELPAFVALAFWLMAKRAGGWGFSWWGMVFNVVGIALVLPLIGFMALASPLVGQLYSAGNRDVLNVATAFYTTPAALVLLAISGVAYTAGSILLALALRRQASAPWSVTVALALQAPCLALLAMFSFFAELAGAVSLIFVSIWILHCAWRQV